VLLAGVVPVGDPNGARLAEGGTGSRFPGKPDPRLTEGADEVFVNGDSFIPEARPLEGVFKRLMLAGPGVG